LRNIVGGVTEVKVETEAISSSSGIMTIQGY
jgi:hypothetical protein